MDQEAGREARTHHTSQIQLPVLLLGGPNSPFKKKIFFKHQPVCPVILTHLRINPFLSLEIQSVVIYCQFCC